MRSSTSNDQIWTEWRDLTNSAPAELERWLDGEEPKSVGESDNGQCTGYTSDRRIVKIQRTNKNDLSDDQWVDMTTVAAYIKRDLSQGGPDEGTETSACRFSVMNWGHDPLKEEN